MNLIDGRASWLACTSRPMVFCCLVILLWFGLTPSSLTASSFNLEIDVDGVERKARVVENRVSSEAQIPLVFAFHGYDDHSRDFSRYVDLDKSWPEAIIVYPLGLQMPDRKGTLRARGWQTSAGMLADRDLHLVDRLMEELGSRYSIDARRVYATGMSNGASFVFLLMSKQPGRFAAFAPVGIAATTAVIESLNTPKPMLYMIGREEPGWRLEAAQLTVEAISRVNRSTTDQEMWAENYILFNHSKGGADLIFNLHKGGHIWPFGASDQIMRFFRQNRLPD